VRDDLLPRREVPAVRRGDPFDSRFPEQPAVIEHHERIGFPRHLIEVPVGDTEPLKKFPRGPEAHHRIKIRERVEPHESACLRVIMERPGPDIGTDVGVVFPAIAARRTSSVEILTGIGCISTRISG